ncbi:CBS domain-containing protein [Roseovarius tibetensis]|uniref:CBS domain-containing protein n=1 Tax=Roseovarius tibetensis TaxID=2685897 RepID=UPI003D7FB88A
MDRPEYTNKFHPLTGPADMSVRDAAAAMQERNYGCIVIVDESNRVEGIVTERDIMYKLVVHGNDPDKVKLSDIMTREIRMAKETDYVLDWLRMMSNERFRRLPVVDSEGRIQALFTQGDFVSYTWPDLFDQARGLAKATFIGKFHYFLIGGGILIYVLAMIVVLSAV